MRDDEFYDPGQIELSGGDSNAAFTITIISFNQPGCNHPVSPLSATRQNMIQMILD